MQRLRLAITMLVGFAGIGVARASPQISVDPDPLDFFQVIVGLQGGTLYTVTNTGRSQLVVKDMRIGGPDADQFHFDDTVDPFCGTGRACTPNFHLAPGESRAFYVVCAPSRPGFFTSTLTVMSNAASRQIALACTGEAPASMSTLVVSPASIDFGISYAEQGSPATLDRTLTVTNTAAAPSPPVEFSVVVPGTTGNGFFLLPAGERGSVGPGQSQDFVIRFRWFAAVTSTAPLVLQSSNPSEPSIDVPMFAETAYGRMTFDDPDLNRDRSITMPAVATGDTSTLTIKAHNSGHFSLGITDAFASAFVGGTAELQGSIFNVILDPGESIEWTLTCTPDGSEGSEAGAGGSVEFNYASSANGMDFFPMFCPILNPAGPIDDQAAVDHGVVGVERIGSSGTPEGGGCSASAPASLATFGMLLLGLLVPGRRTRRIHPPRHQPRGVPAARGGTEQRR